MVAIAGAYLVFLWGTFVINQGPRSPGLLIAMAGTAKAMLLIWLGMQVRHGRWTGVAICTLLYCFCGALVALALTVPVTGARLWIIVPMATYLSGMGVATALVVRAHYCS